MLHSFLIKGPGQCGLIVGDELASPCTVPHSNDRIIRRGCNKSDKKGVAALVYEEDSVSDVFECSEMTKWYHTSLVQYSIP